MEKPIGISMERRFYISYAFLLFSCTFFCALLLSPSLVSGAFISGKIYDLSYNEIQRIVVKVNSTPPQTYVTATGSYSFFLPRGNYQLSAYDSSAEGEIQAAENITILDDGNYTIDLIIYSDAVTPDQQQQLSDATDISSSLSDTSPFGDGRFSWWLGMFMILILAGIALLLFLMPKRDNRKKNGKNRLKVRQRAKSNRKEEKTGTIAPAAHAAPTIHSSPSPDISVSELPRKILGMLDAQEGRMTQKEIRKLLPYSEAKISLVISELEHNGKLKRIKRGRGNIIVKAG